MKTKRILSLALAVVMVLATLAGCGETGEPSAPPPAPTYTLTFEAGGGVGTAPVLGPVEAGTTVNLPQNPFTYEGYTFAGWQFSVGVVYPAGTPITVPARDLTFVATWTPVEPEPEPGPTYDALPTDRTYKVLFIGNSYTFYNSMPTALFYQIASSASYTLEVTTITNGGHSLEAFARPTDTFGAKVSAAIDGAASGKYDYVILQDQSLTPAASPVSTYDAVRNLTARIRAIDAEPVLYSTWGRHRSSGDLSANGWTNASMTWKTAATYQAIADELSLAVAHVGLAFYDVYNGDSGINLYDPDLTHPSYEGSFLAALTLFTRIFGGDPRLNLYQGSLADPDSKTLRQAAFDAVYNTPEIPDEYKATSEGVTNKLDYEIDISQMANLTSLPTDSEVISVLTSQTNDFPNGWNYNGTYFSGILGDSGKVASTEYSFTGLTAAQKEDIADVRNGVSVIGVERMLTGDNTTTGSETAVQNLVNGHWGVSYMTSMEFDDQKYDVDGTVNANGKYRALITLNFGQQCSFDALGFASGSMAGFPQAAEVWVSEDGEEWGLVPTACWDAINGRALVSCSDASSFRDYWNGNTTGTICLFDMNGATGKYVRIGVVIGRNTTATYNSINMREILVYGERQHDASVLFIGNSFTYFNSMPTALFAKMASSVGKTLEVSSITNGGHTLKAFSRPTDTYGAMVAEALDPKNAGKYDYVILQEQSSTPARDTGRPAFYDAVRDLTGRIRALGATPILYSTWGHQTGADVLNETGWSNEVMTWRLAAAYQAIGAETQTAVAPVGQAFLDVNQNTQIDLYASDLYHPSYAGSYLAALTLFAKIFGVDPTTVTFAGELGATEADVLRLAAKNAVSNTPTTPSEYVVTSEGVTESVVSGVDTTKTVPLTTRPASELISILKSDTQLNGYRKSKDGTYYFSGVTGDSGIVAPAHYAGMSDAVLTEEQKADFADIRNGVSVIGLNSMLDAVAGKETAVQNLLNGHWGTSYMAGLVFDDLKYDADGSVNAQGKYRGLITVNLGAVCTVDAFGFASGDMAGFPQIAELYASTDGVSWTLVPSACWDAFNAPLTSCTDTASLLDPWNGNKPGVTVMFDTLGVSAKYLRLGVIYGREGAEAYKVNSINTREILIYGKRGA